MYQDQVAIKYILEVNYSYYYTTCSSPKFAVQTNANVCYACHNCVLITKQHLNIHICTLTLAKSEDIKRQKYLAIRRYLSV